MAINPQFTTTPNNAMVRIASTDSLETEDWTAGVSGGRLHQVYARVVADQEVVVNIFVKVGGTIYQIVRTVPPQIPIADEGTSTQPPTPLLTDINFPGLAQTPEGRALTFPAGDGIRMSIGTTLDAGEMVTLLALGGNF